VSDVLNQLGGCIDLILDGGRTKIGIASTIIDLTRAPPLIVRKGPITKEMVEEIIGYVET
jgi:L-threonylcarbamoyladenylate synthase